MGLDNLVKVGEGVDGGGTDRWIGRNAIGLVALRTWQLVWRRCVLLTIVVALALGVVLAVLLGAARSVTAMDRLREQTRASDVLLVGGDIAVCSTRWRWSGVLQAGASRQLFVKPKGSELVPTYNLLSVAPYPMPGGAPWTCPSSSKVGPPTNRGSTRW